MANCETGKSNKNFAVTIKEYIDENYSDWRISMNVFIELVGFSAVYINRVFKETYGMNPVEYLAKLRLEKAKELIELGTPLGMASYKTGYSSIRTFYRVFEKDTGMSPGKYKQRAFKNYEQFKELVKMHELRPLDYARKACNAIMLSYDPTQLPPYADMEGTSRYSYMQGIFLLGMYRTYDICREKRYLNYISEWCDTIQDGKGRIIPYKRHPERSMYGSLDSRQPVQLFMRIYNETGKAEYLELTEYFMKSTLNWQVTANGIMVHYAFMNENVASINTVYMVCPSMCLYGKMVNDARYYDIAAHQPIAMYEKMLNEKTGLLYHAWDEAKSSDWADPKTGLSGEHWGRGMGYYVMGILDMLDYLPKTHPQRERLIEIVRNCLCAIEKYQHSSGRWYQLVDKCDIKDNWMENSCSCMFVYAFAKAVNLGILDHKYATTAIRGYSGIIDTIEYGENGEMILKDISEGIQAGDDYLDKMSHTNDLHGSGAFVLMCNEIEKLLNSVE